jgi:hypothetical protein
MPDVFHELRENPIVSELVEHNKFVPMDIQDLQRGKIIKEGGSRKCVFVNDNVCLKYVYDDNDSHGSYIFAIAQHILESYAYQQRPDLPLAKCKLYNHNGFLIILMERLTYANIYDQDESVRDFFIRGKGPLTLDASCQCGVNKAGKFLCYDYGVERSLEYAINVEEYIDSLPIFTENSIAEFEKELLAP